MNLTHELQAEIRQVMDDYWARYFSGDLDAWLRFLPDDYRNIGSTEEELWNSKEEVLRYTRAVIDQMAGNVDLRNKQVQIIPYPPYFMVHELGELFIRTGEDWVFYAKFRLSSLLHKTDDGWKVLHQHGSFPDAKAQEGESIGFEKISRENQELREAVNRRTVELHHKNRELEIEAALERVRTVAMGMNKPDDLLNITEALFTQLRGLGFDELRNAMIHAYFDDDRQFLDYDFSDFCGGRITRIPYRGNPVIERFIQDIRKAVDSFTEFVVAGDQLDDWKSFRKANGEIDDPRLDSISSLHYYNYSIGTASIGISTFGPVSDAGLNVLKRFRNVFDFAYKRYTDIAQAEAQAREAKIELALERVRARTMAMQQSEELTDVAAILFKQVSDLGIKTWTAGFNVWSDDDNAYTDFITTPQGNIVETYTIDARIFPVFKEVSDAKKSGIDFYVQYLEGDLLKETYKRLAGFESEKQYEKILADGFQFPEHQYDHFVFGSKVSLMFITYEPVPEAHDIFKRLGKTFEQTYTRFLDLQQAEAQAREAQIQLALERVRARTMAMHNSEDVGKCIVQMFSEVTALGVNEGTRFGIGILNHDNENNQLWTASKDGEEVKMHIGNIDMTSHSLLKSARKAWKEQIPLHRYVLEGEDLLNYYKMLNNAPDYKYRIAIEKLPEREFHYGFVFDHGFFYAFTPHEFQPDLIHIVQRFTSLFEQTYRRYLDLVKAEVQAREAQIEVALERVRSRTNAMQHSDELREAANVLFQQIQTLGIPVWSCGYNIWDEEEKSATGWMCSNDILQPSFAFPLTENPTFIRFYESRQKGETFYVEEVDGPALTAHYGYMSQLPDFSEILQNFMKSGFTLPVSQVHNVVNFSHGNLIFISDKPVPEAGDIFKRFAGVFEQTYTRFLDLQHKEIQARNLEIERLRLEKTLTELRTTQAQFIQKEKLASLGELTAGIAHEIQNPLNFVNNFSEVSAELVSELREEAAKAERDSALMEELLGDLAQNLEKITHHGGRASRIVKGMLDHSRTSTGERHPTDLNALTNEYLHLSYQGWVANHPRFACEVITQFDPELRTVDIVPPEIGRVLLNLFNNAYYAVAKRAEGAGTAYHPTVWVSTSREPQAVEIRVRDNGTGISEAVMAKIFQPFFTTKPTGEGTGLGLSLSYDIITKGHGGSLTVSSSPNLVTEFLICLPA